MSNTDVRKAFFNIVKGNASEKDIEALNNVEVSNDFPKAIKEQTKITLSRKIILEKCKNCERAFNEYGKLCHWRSFGKNYCFDGLTDEEANKEINKHFDYFQTQIARGLVSKELKENV